MKGVLNELSLSKKFIMIAKLQLRADSESNFTSANPVLSKGEVVAVFDEDNNLIGIKIGNGVETFNNLSYLIYDNPQKFAEKLFTFRGTPNTKGGLEISSANTISLSLVAEKNNSSPGSSTGFRLRAPVSTDIYSLTYQVLENGIWLSPIRLQTREELSLLTSNKTVPGAINEVLDKTPLVIQYDNKSTGDLSEIVDPDEFFEAISSNRPIYLLDVTKVLTIEVIDRGLATVHTNSLAKDEYSLSFYHGTESVKIFHYLRIYKEGDLYKYESSTETVGPKSISNNSLFEEGVVSLSQSDYDRLEKALSLSGSVRIYGSLGYSDVTANFELNGKRIIQYQGYTNGNAVWCYGQMNPENYTITVKVLNSIPLTFN